MSKYQCSEIVRLGRAGNEEPDGTVILPPGFLPETDYNSEIKLGFGLREIPARPVNGSENGVISLSNDIFDTLNLCENIETGACYKNATLKLGPLVGVFMNENAVRHLYRNDLTDKMIELLKAASDSKVIMYFFTLGNVLWPENSINATFCKPDDNSFERRIFPLPDVLYDRGGGFTTENLVKAKELRSSLYKIPGLQMVNNQHYFDKWDLYCQLSKYDDMKVYLPGTALFNNNTGEIVQMLDKYGEIYMKMLTGSNGREVIRVRRLQSSQYEYSYFKEKVIKGITLSADELVGVANELMDNRSFIIQQGIDVITHENNKVDVRVLVQRDGMGEWQITSIPVRIAVDDCAVTSTKSGSKVYCFYDAFVNILKIDQRQADIIKAEILKLIWTAVSALEKAYGTLGELGIDVAVDRNYNPWFIESNAKPAKDTVLIAGPIEDIKKSFRLPFEYCRYLTGFRSVSDENGTMETAGY